MCRHLRSAVASSDATPHRLEFVIILARPSRVGVCELLPRPRRQRRPQPLPLLHAGRATSGTHARTKTTVDRRWLTASACRVLHSYEPPSQASALLRTASADNRKGFQKLRGWHRQDCTAISRAPEMSHLEQGAVAVLLADDGHRAAKPELLPAACKVFMHFRCFRQVQE